MESLYFDAAQIQAEVDAGHHRQVIGDMWDTIGKLQFDYLRKNGLLPQHRLLDLGCGCLRGGVHFIRYLAPGNYFGTDLNASLLTAGYDLELPGAGIQDRMPRENLGCSSEFDSEFGVQFDFALAQSLFTHLVFNRIRQCLERLVFQMKPGGLFFATFFELPEGQAAWMPLRHPHGVVTHDVADPYHYRFADLKHAAANLPWATHYMGDWNHPRDQRMVLFERLAG
jgi:hypothetical protein